MDGRILDPSCLATLYVIEGTKYLVDVAPADKLGAVDYDASLGFADLYARSAVKHVGCSLLRFCGVFATVSTLQQEIATSRRFRYGEAILTPAQCRMARAAVQLGVRELADAAKVSTNTITRFEKGEDLKERTIHAIRAALEAAGVIFLDCGQTIDGGPGVRLKP